MSIPQIRTEAIEAVGRKILMEYDPSLLSGQPCPVPIETIIETKFDLILEFHTLRKNPKILGETIFDDGAVVLYDQIQRQYRMIAVRAGTILIDERLCDAYSDLQLYLLELLHSGKLTKLQRKDDGTLVKYIESSIRHQYISLNSRKNAVDNSVIASVDEIDFNQMSLSSNDEYPELLISDLHSVLQPSELTLLSQFVFKGMSIADIAEKSGVSRQAINRKKLSILKKLECAFFPKTSK